jgi:hypothetical protein
VHIRQVDRRGASLGSRQCSLYRILLLQRSGRSWSSSRPLPTDSRRSTEACSQHADGAVYLSYGIKKSPHLSRRCRRLVSTGGRAYTLRRGLHVDISIGMSYKIDPHEHEHARGPHRRACAVPIHTSWTLFFAGASRPSRDSRDFDSLRPSASIL